MKNIKLKGRWVGWKTAMNWKEGCVVVIMRKDRDITNHGGLELIRWFRPYWVNSANGYGTSKSEFLKLSK